MLSDPLLAAVALVSQGLVTSMYYPVHSQSTRKRTFLLGGLGLAAALVVAALLIGAAEGLGKVLLFVGAPGVVQAFLWSSSVCDYCDYCDMLRLVGEPTVEAVENKEKTRRSTTRDESLLEAEGE